MRAEPVAEDEDIIGIPPTQPSMPPEPKTSPDESVHSSSPAFPNETTFDAPPVVHGIDDTISDRLSGSLSDLSARISSAVRDSSVTVSRAWKKAVPNKSSSSVSPCPLILCFGDSLTERGASVTENDWGIGWIAHISDHFRGRADVIARGFSGYNTRNALAMLPSVLAGPSQYTTVALVWFGANDAVLRGRGDQHVGVEEYGLNLCKIVFELTNYRKESPIVPVLVTPPPLQQELSDARWSVDEGGTRSNEVTKTYADACTDVARRMGVPCVDIYSQMTEKACDQEGLKHFLCDGLHLSGAGNKLVADHIYETLCKSVSSFDVDNMRQWFTPWQDLQGCSNDDVTA